MRAEKATRLRPACAYVAAAVCAAAGAWSASYPPPTLGIVQALDRANRDTQLPLERFAIEAGNAAASSQQLPREVRPQQAARLSQPNQGVGTAASDWSGQAQIGLAGLGTDRLGNMTHGYFRKIQDWRSWT
jgi:hypothetical protein